MAHIHDNNQPNPETHFFAMGMLDNSNQYFLIGPNYNAPQNTVTLNPPDSLRKLTQDIIKVGNCVNGYLCFYGYNAYENKYKVVMWNPIDGTTLPEATFTLRDGYTTAFVGCGVCPVNGPKIVMISARDTTKIRTEWQNNIDVYTVRTGLWRNVQQDRRFESCVMECAKFCVNGRFIYMRAYDTSKLPPGERLNFFISFDFVREQFGVVPLPGRLSRTPNEIQSVKVNGSLGLLEYRDGNCHVWTTEEDDGTFTWFTIRSFPAEPFSVMTLRNNGMAVKVKKVNVGDKVVSLSTVRLLI